MTAAAEMTTRADVTIPPTNTTVYEALHQRAMSWQFKEDPVPREALERMLATAVWAPNHRLTEPWRLFVVEKDSAARRQIGDLAYEYVLGRTQNEARAEAGRQKVLAPPIVLYAYTVPGPNEEATQENYASVCCATQNISLAGVAEGLACTWETGGVTRHPGIKEVLGAEEEWTMAVMVFIGYPAEEPKSSRTPVSQFVQWFS